MWQITCDIGAAETYHLHTWLLTYLPVDEGVRDEDEDLPVKDIDDAIQSELNKLQYSRLRMTGTARKMSAKDSEKQSEIKHTEL